MTHGVPVAPTVSGVFPMCSLIYFGVYVAVSLDRWASPWEDWLWLPPLGLPGAPWRVGGAISFLFRILEHQDRPLGKGGLKVRECALGNIEGLVYSERCPFSFCTNPRKRLWFFSFYSLEGWVRMRWGLSKFPEIGWLWAKWQDSVSGVHVLFLWFKCLFLASESVSRYIVQEVAGEI